jgi:hypothetical protein
VEVTRIFMRVSEVGCAVTGPRGEEPPFLERVPRENTMCGGVGRCCAPCEMEGKEVGEVGGRW